MIICFTQYSILSMKAFSKNAFSQDSLVTVNVPNGKSVSIFSHVFRIQPLNTS